MVSKMRLKYTLILTLFSALAINTSLSAREIHKERSIYRNIVITENKGKRCMRFETRRRSVSNQACMRVKNPDQLVFEYTQSLMAGLGFNSQPKNILIIGLGGGSLPMAFSKILPESNVTSVEIDPAVVKLAKKYFDYQESEKIKTVVKDGRVFIKRAIKNKQQFDWIILDAFNGDYIPEHLLTVEFLAEAKTLLSKGGLLSANTFTGSRLYDYESVTYQTVFEKLQILPSASKGNRIIFACNCDNIEKRDNVSEQLKNSLKRIGVDFDSLIARLSGEVNWDTSVKPLTDQYSPANLLNQ